MIDLVIRIAAETGTVLYEGSLYILIGFFVAGLLHEFLPTDIIARHLGGERPRAVILAALFGAPIPLCSCGVLPAAAALRDKGAGRSSTLSFLISTPETGVDSIALTYGLLGPVMAIIRPLVAIVTGTIAGLISIALPDDARSGENGYNELVTGDVCSDGHDHASELPVGDVASIDDLLPPRRWRRVLGYGFGTLLDEIAFWLAGGILLTGVLSALLPADFFTRVLGWESGLLPMLAMVVAGVPLYLCASASTPVAAALIAKGLSPGAALVFLLVGPATNAATMTVVARLLGPRRLRIYLGSIIGVSLVAGLLVDAWGYEALRRTALDGVGSTDGAWMSRIKLAAALLFTGLVVASLTRVGLRGGIADLRSQLMRVGPAVRAMDWRRMWTPRTAALVTLALAVWAMPAALLVVAPGQVGVTQRFGAVSATDLAPGLHLHLPPPLGRGTTVDTGRVRSVSVGFRGDADGQRPGISEQAFYLTADENIIDLRTMVEYRVADPLRYAFGIKDTERMLRAAARRQLVDLVGAGGIDKLYTTERGPTERRLFTALRAHAEKAALGIEVTGVRLLDVHAPADVHDAFRDVASAIEDRNRDILDAAGYAAESEASTRGDAAAVGSTSRADRKRTVALARATAAAFGEINRAHAAAPAVTKARLFLETMERSLAAPRKYITPTADGGGQLDVWLGDRRMMLEDVAPPSAATDDSGESDRTDDPTGGRP